MSYRCAFDSGTLHYMPEILPAPESADWARLYPRMKERFIHDNRDVRPPIKLGRLLIIHPAYHGLEDQARAIHNDELTPAEDGDGNAIPLPRVWRWEHQLKVYFVMEAPEGFTLRTLLLKTGDRELMAS